MARLADADAIHLAACLEAHYTPLQSTNSLYFFRHHVKELLNLILDFSPNLRVDSASGNGWEPVFELQASCKDVYGLLEDRPLETNLIGALCKAVMGQFYALVWRVNPEHALVLQIICPIQGRTLG